MATNPIIKFTTLFGLLAVELSDGLLRPTLWVVFLTLALVFAWRSFYRMRIDSSERPGGSAVALSTEAA